MTNFVHEDPDFDDLLSIVASARGLSLGLVEKDYWVTHTLWALQATGFDLWFKGGTSLSKGFGLIERFSEDLDLKIEPGTVVALPEVTTWKSDGKQATASRNAYFEALSNTLDVPGATVTSDPDTADPFWRAANYRVAYPGSHIGDLAGVLRPHVLLEVGSARVTPFVRRDMTSFVHDQLAATGQTDSFLDNRPGAVRCVHPLVTLLEKIDALHKRVPRDDVDPPAFVRHFEDAARIIAAESSLPELPGYPNVRALAEDMLAQNQVRAMPDAGDMAIIPGATPRWDRIRDAHSAIAPMFWGPRIEIDDACASIRAWANRAMT